MHSLSFQENPVFYRTLNSIEDDEVEEQIGKDKSLVFLHGFLEDSSIWDQIVPTFQKLGYKCVLIDLPCHGLSRFNGDNCSMSYMAEAVHAVLKQEDVYPEKIIGHSMGGYVALEMTKHLNFEPILLHSNFWEDNHQKKIDRNRVIEIVKKNKSLFINEAIPGLFAPQNKEANTKVVKELISKANELPASEICASTAGMRDRSAFYCLHNHNRFSIIHGELDPIIASDQMYIELEKTESTYLFTSMQEVGHMGIWEDPKTVISSIKSILFS